MSRKFHVDKKTNSRYDMILGRDLLTSLRLDLKCYQNLIIGDEGLYEGYLAPKADLSKYDFKYLMEK